MQFFELRGRIEPEAVEEGAPHPPIDRERVRLSAGPVERQHQLAMRLLPEWVLRDQPLELGDGLGMPPQRQVGVDAVFETPEPCLVEPRGSGSREVLVRDVCQRRAAPERERRRQETLSGLDPSLS